MGHGTADGPIAHRLALRATVSIHLLRPRPSRQSESPDFLGGKVAGPAQHSGRFEPRDLRPFRSRIAMPVRPFSKFSTTSDLDFSTTSIRPATLNADVGRRQIEKNSPGSLPALAAIGSQHGKTRQNPSRPTTLRGCPSPARLHASRTARSVPRSHDPPTPQRRRPGSREQRHSACSPFARLPTPCPTSRPRTQARGRRADQRIGQEPPLLRRFARLSLRTQRGKSHSTWSKPSTGRPTSPWMSRRGWHADPTPSFRAATTKVPRGLPRTRGPPRRIPSRPARRVPAFLPMGPGWSDRCPLPVAKSAHLRRGTSSGCRGASPAETRQPPPRPGIPPLAKSDRCHGSPTSGQVQASQTFHRLRYTTDGSHHPDGQECTAVRSTSTSSLPRRAKSRPAPRARRPRARPRRTRRSPRREVSPVAFQQRGQRCDPRCGQRSSISREGQPRRSPWVLRTQLWLPR